MSFDYIINTDGGARGNPGIAGAGVVIRDVESNILKESFRSLGVQTNNFAEYSGVMLALEELEKIVEEGDRESVNIEIKMDSELIVEQLSGNYKVKSDSLRPLFEEIKTIKENVFPNLTFTHVRREENKEADKLANKAMDEADT